jgi:PPK2 family polyphosphate:nucleotide phosphotransferase
MNPNLKVNKVNYSRKFIVKPGKKINLKKFAADFSNQNIHQDQALARIDRYKKKLFELQYLLYAEGKRSLLICLQGRDAAGKDGTINHIFSAMNPQGCTVTGFKVPSKEEAAHDFLWRYHKAAPGRGQVAIFNRSHYEEVLVQRVHEMVPKKIWSKRYEHINDFERMLSENGTHILKFYLHIDADEQLRRFKKRLDDPSRHWKISDADYAERPFWDAYTKAFEDALSKCSTKHAPWFIIPSNNKWIRNLAISKIVADKLESLNMEFPEPSVDINEIRKKYHKLMAKEGLK